MTKKVLFSLFISLTCIFSSLLLFSCKGDTIPVESISFEQEEIELYKSGSMYLRLNILPSNAKNFYLDWSSSDPQVATINKEGKVKAVNYGTAIITCTVRDQGKSTSCEVTVSDGGIVTLHFDELSMIKTYFEGQSFSYTDLHVWASFESGVEREIPQGEYEIIVPDPLKIGDSAIIKYKNYEKVIPLNILEDFALGLQVTKPPVKTEYFIGEMFDNTGMEVSLVYASGRTEVIEDFTYTKNPLMYDGNSIKITYQDFVLDYPITLKAHYTVSNYSDLQTIVDSAGNNESIMIKGTHSNVKTIRIPKSKNLTIVGQSNDGVKPTINTSSGNPAFIIYDDIDTDSPTSFTLANLNIVAPSNDSTPLITYDNSQNKLNNFTLNIENVYFNYSASAIEITSKEGYLNNINVNIILSTIRNKNAVQTENSYAVVMKGLSNGKLDIKNSEISNIDDAILIENCQNFDISIDKTNINSSNTALNIKNLTESSIVLSNNSYLKGNIAINLDSSSANEIIIENCYLSGIQQKEDITENEMGIVYLIGSSENNITIKNTEIKNQYMNNLQYQNAILHLVEIKDGTALSSNNTVTLDSCNLVFVGNGEQFKISEQTETSKITIVSEEESSQ